MDLTLYSSSHFTRINRRSDYSIKPKLNIKYKIENFKQEGHSNPPVSRSKSSEKPEKPKKPSTLDILNNTLISSNMNPNPITQNENINSQVPNKVLETCFRSRRNSIQSEVKTIFLDSQIKNSCMVQTEEMPDLPITQPVSLLSFIKSSSQKPRIKVNRDIRKSLSIKKYEKPENLVHSYKNIKNNNIILIDTFGRTDIKNVKNSTPTGLKIRIHKKNKLDKTCKILNLGESSTLFTENKATRPLTATSKDSNQRFSKVFRFAPVSCKSYTPIKLQHQL